MAQEVSVESEEPIAEKRPPLPSSAPQVRFEEKNSYAKLHGRRQGSTPLPQRGGHEVDTPEPTPSAWTRQQELEREQLQRENQALRAKLKKSEDQLMEARRVISEQLGELSSLKAAKDASSRVEEDLKDRLQKLRRSAKLTESHHKDEVDTLRCQFERLKVFYESQIADLRRQLAVEMGRYPARGVSPRQRHHKGPHPAEAPVTPVSVNVSEASTTGRRPSEREAVGSEDLAEQLKGWLYAEMRGDLTKMEEERLLSEVRRSLRDDEGSSSRGQSPRALLESFIEKHAEYHSGKAEKGQRCTE
ncbi:hypothetical protein AGDE_15438 [Angomonas deanei]|uniref:Uncharacterized protein n=1 Tax=Angomonas deanei TaxID=59799 RepID=A0A7G2CTW2_9TRYP|nr:hypothetical protein AGDE_15438 [Angomonas deanei]CAD2222985.1 hypothetical protein, conserved [Angomonas deanei]|eukprot:EPY19068.1 hypothetical protein AGDE_15438 [Angomonas deanei]